MSVFFRTGDGSAVGIPWWVYVFFVLPVQLMWLFAKFVVYLAALLIGAAGIAIFWLYGVARVLWNERKPPHPEG